MVAPKRYIKTHITTATCVCTRVPFILCYPYLSNAPALGGSKYLIDALAVLSYDEIFGRPPLRYILTNYACTVAIYIQSSRLPKAPSGHDALRGACTFLCGMHRCGALQQVHISEAYALSESCAPRAATKAFSSMTHP